MRKKLIYFLSMMSMLLLPTACYNDDDLTNRVDNLEGRVGKLEEAVAALNTNVATLSELMTGKKFITSVEDDGKGTKTVHLISSNGEMSTIVIKDGANGKDGLNGADGKDGLNGADGKDGLNGADGKDGVDGKDGLTPVVSVRQDSDGNWYWTVNGEWLVVDGQKVRANGIDGINGVDGKDGQNGKDGADGKDGQNGKDGVDGQNGKDGVDGKDGKDGVDGKDGINGADGQNGQNGISPAFRIENGRWMVSLDRGLTWHDCGQATGADGDSFFTDAEQSADGRLAYLTLSDGTVLAFELYKEFGVAFNLANVFVPEGKSRDIEFVVTGITPGTQVEALGKKGWDAEAKLNADGTGVLTVTAPAGTGAGKIIVLVNDGGDKTVMRTLTFVGGNMQVSTTSAEVDQAGGTSTISVTTDLEFTIGVEEGCDWVTVKNTRAVRTENFEVTVSPSDDPTPRTALLTITSLEGLPLETILVVQSPVTFDEKRLVFRVDPSKAPESGVSLPFSYTTAKGGTIYIDWGDGSETTEITSPSTTQTLATADRYPKHVYADKTKKYNVQCWGSINRISGGALANCYGITDVIQWGKNFYYTEIQFKSDVLESLPAPAPYGETTQFYMLGTVKFDSCTALRRISPDFFKGVTDKLYSFNQMFRYCKSLEEIPEGFFDPVVKISSMQEMFYGCTNLKSVKSGFAHVKDLGTVSATTTETCIGVFRDCESLQELPEKFFPENWICRNKTFTNLFCNCKSLKRIPEKFFEGAGTARNTNNDKPLGIEILSMMFYNCSSLEYVNLDWLNSPGGLQIYNWSSFLSGCEKLDIEIPSYEWEYNGEKMTVWPWDREKLTNNADADLKAAAQAVFGTRTSHQYSDAFKDDKSLKQWPVIPTSWGGGCDGYTGKPEITVTGYPEEGKEYYSVAFKVNTKEAAELYYYLATPKGLEEVLPKYNNSMEDLVLAKGSKLVDSYYDKYVESANSETGLEIYFDGGMPENDYCMVVAAVNPRGLKVAYAETSTTKMPKGCDDFEAMIGTWTVTPDATLINKLDENGDIVEVDPLTFDITLVPERVDESYFLYGWGYTQFRESPLRAFFNKETHELEIWYGNNSERNGGNLIMNGFQFGKADNPEAKFENYNVYYYPYLEDNNTHSINFWSPGYNPEQILGGKRIEALDRIVINGVRSNYNSTPQNGDLYWVGLEACLCMGSMSTSQYWTPIQVYRPEYVVEQDGVKYDSHHIAPYTLTRAQKTSAPAKKAAKQAVPANGLKAKLR